MCNVYTNGRFATFHLLSDILADLAQLYLTETTNMCAY